MSHLESVRAWKHQLVCIVGMAMIWPSLHNQIMYPITFAFRKEGAGSPYLYYLIYSLVMLATLIVIAVNQKRMTKRLFCNASLLSIIGVVGAIGIALLVICDFTSPLASIHMGFGIVLSAVFVPIYFIFWSVQITSCSERRVAFDLIASYLLFCLITAVRLGLQLHAWPFSIGYPLVAAALVPVALNGPQKEFALRQDSLAQLPWRILGPSVALAFLAVIGMTILNPLSATNSYPPFHRVAIYLSLGVLMGILAVFYKPKSTLRNKAEVLSFGVLTLFLVGALLLMGLGTLEASHMGNFPAIAAKISIEMFIWLLVLSNAQIKHTGIISSAAAYLIFVIGAGYMISFIALGGEDLLDLSKDSLPVLSITVALAFVVTVVVNLALVLMVYESKAPKKPAAVQAALDLAQSQAATDAHAAPSAAAPSADAMPACLSIASDEAAIQRIRETFGLSARETDTLRLAARSMSAKAIAERLFVAESTVNSHIKGIYRKCDVHSRQDLIALVNRYKKEIR